MIARDLVLLEQARDALREPADDAFFALEHALQIQLDAADLDPKIAERMRGFVEALARFEQRLARDAADPQACAAERCLGVDARGVQAELRRADCRDVAARAGTDDEQVMLVSPLELPRRTVAGRFQTSSSMRDGASMHCLMRFKNVTASRPSTSR